MALKPYPPYQLGSNKATKSFMFTQLITLVLGVPQAITMRTFFNLLNTNSKLVFHKLVLVNANNFNLDLSFNDTQHLGYVYASGTAFDGGFTIYIPAFQSYQIDLFQPYDIETANPVLMCWSANASVIFNAQGEIIN